MLAERNQAGESTAAEKMVARRNTLPSIVGTDGACNRAVSVSSVTNSSTNDTSTSRCEIASMKKTAEGLIANVVNTDVFPFMKFITCDAEMEAGFAHFGGKILSKMGVTDDNRSVWWSCYKLAAKRALNQKRSAVGSAIKTTITGK
jgi:hypothetical protein